MAASRSNSRRRRYSSEAASRERICTFANGCSEQNAESTRERRRGSGWNRAQPKRSGDTGSHGVHLGLERIVFGEDPLGPHHQSLPFGREVFEAVTPIDQRDVQLPFELGDRGGQRRLGDCLLYTSDAADE